MPSCEQIFRAKTKSISRRGARRCAYLPAPSIACGWRPRRSDDSPECVGGARARAASPGDGQEQPLALAPVAAVRRLGREHQPERVDHVRPRLLARPALAEDAGDFGDRRDHPAVLSRLEDDRQRELLLHVRIVARTPGSPPVAVSAVAAAASLRAMRVLVTGGAGFIGSHFVRRLADAGDTLVVLDKLTYSGNPANLEG